MPWWVSPIRRRSGCYPSSQTMFTAARIWFLVAWACPTVALIGGGLPTDRLCAAFIAAALSGALICALPVAGLIFFQYRGKPQNIKSMELIYNGPAGTVSMPLQP